MYVCISGNTGVGKSTLIRKLNEVFTNRGFHVTCFDEKNFHHSYLQKMFDSPYSWAFPIQLNFILQRYIELKEITDNIKLKSLILMERSLSEDNIFFTHYLERKNITKEESLCYGLLHKKFINDTIKPDLIVHLKSDVNSIVKRIENAYRLNERPIEITGEKLSSYVIDLNEKYEKWGEQMKDDFNYLELKTEDTNKEFDSIVETISLFLNSK